MSSSNMTRPVVIRRRKVVAAAGHHGGAWKVAYADFVTAMMAFFMMLWLLGATTDVQRKGIADFFAPTIPVARASGGSDGLFGGETPAAHDDVAFTGDRLAMGVAGPQVGADAAPPETAALDRIAEVLLGRGGESLLSDMALRHVVTRLTDEGLVVEVFSLPDAPLFAPDTAEILPRTAEIIAVIADVADMVFNDMAVAAHLPARPVVRVGETVWPLSSARAEAVRHRLVADGVARGRLMRVTGHADRSPAVENPLSPRNDRFEVIFLRR